MMKFSNVKTTNVGVMSSFRFTVDFILLTITQPYVMELSVASKKLGKCMAVFLSWSQGIQKNMASFCAVDLVVSTAFARVEMLSASFPCSISVVTFTVK
jgi:hypothetical protein